MLENTPPFKWSDYFYETLEYITGKFEHFHYFTVKTRFLENKSLFEKARALSYSWTYHDRKRNISYKTVLPKASFKTSRMGCTKWTYHKERSFDTIWFFWKFNFSIKTSYHTWLKVLTTQMFEFIFFLSVMSFILGCFFNVSILKKRYENHEKYFNAEKN